MAKWLFWVLIPMGSMYGFCLFAAWLIRRQTDSYQDDLIDARIAEAGARPRFVGFDPTLRERSEGRRKAADAFRGRAARVDAGESLRTVLRAVK